MIKQGTHDRAPVQKGHIQEKVEVETQATREEYRNIAQVCGDGVRKAKAKLDLKLASDVTRCRLSGKGFTRKIPCCF